MNQLIANPAAAYMQGLSGALQTGQQMSEINRQNALAQFTKEHGAGLAQGDPRAMNALAQIDPMQAFTMQRTMRADQRDEQIFAMSQEELSMAKAKAAREMEREAANLSAAEAKAASERLERVLQGGMAAPDEASYNAHLQQNGFDPAQMPFAQRELYAAQAMGYKEVLDIKAAQAELTAPPKPLSPEGKLQADISAGIVDPSQSASTTEADREIARMESIGIPRDVAIRIKEGVFRLDRDPTTREVQVVDLSTGQIVYGGSRQTETPSPTPPASAGEFGQPFSDAPNAFGVEGAIRGTVNSIGDTIGVGPAFPETQQTQRDFDVLRERLIADIANGYGRQPPSWLLKNIEELTPKAGSIFNGPSNAKSKLTALGRDLNGELDDAVFASKQALSPADKAAIQSRIRGLASAVNRINRALNSFEGTTQGRTESGITFKVID